jgi:nucleoside-diphosphate-sugar epimerase
MMNTILVTGATGFVGSNLVKKLAGKGYRIIALCKDREGWDGVLNESNGEGEFFAYDPYRFRRNKAYLENVEVVKGDITLPLLGLSSRRFRRLAWQVDTIFHCEAVTDFKNRGRLFRTNVEGTRHLLQFALLGRKKHFHFISSIFVAGKSNGAFYERDFNKNQGFNNSYEESIFNAESVVRRFARQYLLPFTIYRPSIIVGDSHTGWTRCYNGFYTFARALFLIRKWSLGEQGSYPEAYYANFGMGRLPMEPPPIRIPLKVFGDPEGLINLVPVDYVVEAISELATNAESSGTTFHLINPHPITVLKLLDMVSNALGMEGIEPQSVKGHRLASVKGCISSKLLADSGLSIAERFFLRYTRSYLPYLYSRTHFDASNTINTLGGAVTCPEITHPLVSLLVNRAIEDGWGKAVEQDLYAEAVAEGTQLTASLVRSL